MHSCNNCGYCQRKYDEERGEYYYCNDLDCEVDPCDTPICSEDNYNS